MKKSELIKIIRVAVREELKSTLPSIIDELTTRGTTSTKSDNTDIVEVAKQKIKTIRKSKPIKNYSKNVAINEILNETVGGIPQEGSLVSSSEEINKFTDINGQQVDINALPDHLSSALTRNYSDVLKLVDKKKGGIS
tara:strand:- start:257 stop:670 length:414 start_codon:yes stop_codon:yes gene_type:complete